MYHGRMDAQKRYDQAKACVDGIKTEGCQDLLQEQGQRLLEDAGVPSDIAEAAADCIRHRDREKCARASAELAATYGCVAATSGAGTVLCKELAPIVIDKVWPVLGPPLVATWDVALDVIEGVFDGLEGFLEGLADLLGFGWGDDGPTWTQKMNALRGQGHELISTSIEDAYEAVARADISSRMELGLPIPATGHPLLDGPGDRGMPSGDIQAGMGAPNMSKRTMVDQIRRRTMTEILADAPPRSTMVFRDHISRQPGWGELCVVGPARKELWKWKLHPNDLALVQPGTSPAKGQMMLRSAGRSADWVPGDSGTPAAFAVEHGVPGDYWTDADVATAYGVLLGARLDAMRLASTDASGEIISHNVQETQAEEASESSSWWLWLLLAAGAGAGYYYWRRRVE